MISNLLREQQDVIRIDDDLRVHQGSLQGKRLLPPGLLDRVVAEDVVWVIWSRRGVGENNLVRSGTTLGGGPRCEAAG